MEFTHPLKIECPTVPSFVKVKTFGEETSVSVRLIPEEQLRALGAEWIEKLVAKSKEPKPRNDFGR